MQNDAFKQRQADSRAHFESATQIARNMDKFMARCVRPLGTKLSKRRKHDKERLTTRMHQYVYIC